MRQTDKALELLQHVGNELILLWWQLDTYQELFVLEQEKRKPLQERTAPGFFEIIQITLAESILMRLFRLLDNKTICRKENSCLQHLNDELRDDNAAQRPLKIAISEICDQWKADQGAPASLKVFRDKFLAHNDFAERSQLEANQLWMNLLANDFAIARTLADRLWTLYRQANLALRGTDVVEPTHRSLEHHPSMILKHLCASQYLDNVVKKIGETGEIAQWTEQRAKLARFQTTHMGEDHLHAVFHSANGV